MLKLENLVGRHVTFRSGDVDYCGKDAVIHAQPADAVSAPYPLKARVLCQISEGWAIWIRMENIVCYVKRDDPPPAYDRTGFGWHIAEAHDTGTLAPSRLRELGIDSIYYSKPYGMVVFIGLYDEQKQNYRERDGEPLMTRVSFDSVQGFLRTEHCDSAGCWSCEPSPDPRSLKLALRALQQIHAPTLPQLEAHAAIAREVLWDSRSSG